MSLGLVSGILSLAHWSVIVSLHWLRQSSFLTDTTVSLGVRSSKAPTTCARLSGTCLLGSVMMFTRTLTQLQGMENSSPASPAALSGLQLLRLRKGLECRSVGSPCRHSWLGFPPLAGTQGSAHPSHPPSVFPRPARASPRSPLGGDCRPTRGRSAFIPTRFQVTHVWVTVWEALCCPT